MSNHLAMVDAVNDAKTQAEHDTAYWKLMGWREGFEYCADRRLNLIGADLHTMERFGEDRPMCAGVLLDWAPAEPIEAA